MRPRLAEGLGHAARNRRRFLVRMAPELASEPGQVKALLRRPILGQSRGSTDARDPT